MRNSLLLIACIAVTAIAAVAAPQSVDPVEPKLDEKFRVDPYTENDPEALARAGYLRYAPFPFLGDHSTTRTEKALGRIPILWIETPHFKIGSALKSCTVPRDKKQKKRLRAELEALAGILPNIKPKTRRLDPWLRAHLFAYRLEKYYGELSALCGVDDASFPPLPKQQGSEQGPPARQLVDGKYMGKGPYFGQRSKFLVLLGHERTTINRFMSSFAQRDQDIPARHYFPESDTFFFGSAIQFGKGAFREDQSFHAHVLFNMTHNLLDGYKGYHYRSQAWWTEGLAHYFARRASTKHNNYSGIVYEGEHIYTTTKWNVETRKRLKHDLMRPLGELVDRFVFTDFKLVDHMACWSRIDFLVSLGNDHFARFLDAMKGFFPPGGGVPSEKELVARMNEAMKLAWDFDTKSLDIAWKRYIAEHYPRK